MELNTVDWGAATAELTDELRRTGTPRARRKLAAISSLRARFTTDYAIASASASAAMLLEPLEPLHQLRDALGKLRFGDLARAIARIERFPEAIADLPLVLVVKALATLRRGEPRAARNIADRALQVDPKRAVARFLYVEANLAAQTKGGLDKLAELPRGPEHEPAWADLLAKLAILRPNDHRAVSSHLDRGVLAKGSRPDAIVRAVMTWAAPATTADELARAVEELPVGTPAEELALSLLATKLAAGDAMVACSTLRALADRLGEGRPAVRRTLVAALTRLAVVESSAERFGGALRLVQTCAELEPHEPMHQQNTATLFTLLGEHDAALDAWAELDRLHYRLALLGRVDATSATRYAAPHRMFALAARLSPGTTRTGVFVTDKDSDGKLDLEINQEGLDRDPEQLRHWLHHSRAALTFELLALGTDRDRVLLAPMTPVDAAARVDGMCVLAQSLGVMVRDEGRMLADKLAKRFRGIGAGAGLRYVPIALDVDAQVVQRHALELYAELAMLCCQWFPDPARRSLIDEVLESLRAVAPLFDDRALVKLVKDLEGGPPSALTFLRGAMFSFLEIDREDRETPLDAHARKHLTNMFASRLRVRMIDRRYQEAFISQDECEQLVGELDLARLDDPASAHLEYVAAKVLAAGDFYDEALTVIKAFHRIVKGEHPLLARVEKLQAEIDKARADGRGKQRTRKPGAIVVPRGGSAAAAEHARDARDAAAARDSRDFAARETELEEHPTSIKLYSELCHDLAIADRWRDAHAWAQRAISRCLTSAGQVRARELALELIGLEALAAKDRGAVASYVAGARAAALPALEKMPSGSDGLEYVRGTCLLAADRRVEARAAFTAALDACTRGLYLAVLRPLAVDVERALLDGAKHEIETACGERRYADAYARIVERMATVVTPAPYLIELARVQLAALLNTVGTANPPAAIATVRVGAPAGAAWQAELNRTLAITDVAARTRALVALAVKHDDASAREANALIRKLDELDLQLAAAALLDRSNARATANDFDGALAVLADVPDALARNPRVLRQRVILLLRLERYADSDVAAARLGELADPVARELVRRYPGLRLRQQIATASALIRTREFDRARALLATAIAAEPDQQVELAYCQACCAAADGYRRDENGDRAGALRLLFDALRFAEGVLEHARKIGYDRLVELQRKLEVDVAALEGGHA